MALTLGQKAGWGLADMGVVVFVVVKQLLIFSFLTDGLGVPAGLAGLVTSSVLIFDIVTDPVVGFLSDRTQSRWGRRAPWMVVGAVVMAVAMIALFSVPEGMSQGANIAWVIAFFGLATIGFTFVAVPYSASAGEITVDPKERSAMTGWRMAFASIGILIGGAVIPALAGNMGISQAMWYVAPFLVLFIWVSVWMVRRAPRVADASEVNPLRALSLIRSNRPFVVLMVLYGMMTFAIALITVGLPAAALYLIFDTGDTLVSGAAGALGIVSMLLASFVVGALLSQVVWVALSAKLGKFGALILGLILYVVMLVSLYTQLPSEQLGLIALMFVLAGAANGAYQQIPFAMYPDLMDVTRNQSGEAIEGAFSAAWLFGQKVGNATAPLVFGLILAIGGYQETVAGEVADQTPTAIVALQSAITLIPAGVLALTVLGLFLFYRPMMARDGLHRAA